ncbi:hypothetical protein RSOL_164760, partial [Rhizoctonia solani AG-3 Rhs1AP]
MIITIYAGYLADTDLYSQWCVERAEVDPLFAKCYEDWKLSLDLGPLLCVVYGIAPLTTGPAIHHQGLFYDFSPEVAAAILERMNDKYKRMEDAKPKRAAQATQAAQSKKPKKGSNAKANAVAANLIENPAVEQ